MLLYIPRSSRLQAGSVWAGARQGRAAAAAPGESWPLPRRPSLLPARRTEVPGDPVGHGVSVPERRGFPLTCQGLVTKKPGNLLLAVLLLFIRQQLVDKLPNDLLGRCVQQRVHIHNESVNIPAKLEREGWAGSASLRHSPTTPLPWAPALPSLPPPGSQLPGLPLSLAQTDYFKAEVPGCE